jgi:hypothetical protein
MQSHSDQSGSGVHVDTKQADMPLGDVEVQRDAVASPSRLTSAQFPTEVGYGYVSLQDLPTQQIAAEDQAPVPALVTAIDRIGEAVRTCRFVLALAIGELALYVAPGGSELKRYLDAVLKECSHD